MNVPTTIELGRGLGDLLFGSTRKEILAILGEPEKIDSYADDGSDDSDTEAKIEAWYYYRYNLNLHFDASDDFKLGTLEVYGDEYSLNGACLIGCSKEEVFELISGFDFGPPEVEDMSYDQLPELKRELVSFDTMSLNLYFEKDVLSEIQWEPFWIDDDTVEWPSK